METISQSETAPMAQPPFLEGGSRRETVWLFSKGDDLPLSRNFSSGEFACHCGDRGCHMTLIHPKLVETLQTLRDR
ncbi:MAG: hypothetical protein OEW12_06725, partial [Deltaproteobacteria bacterium]|nr:hypothetical protein [Deltaproteobacteria bacterium]